MANDEEFARLLQAQFDAEDRAVANQEFQDAAFAQRLASQSHELSDDSEDDDVVEIMKCTAERNDKKSSANTIVEKGSVKSIKEHTLSDEEDDHPTVAVKDKQKTPSRQGSVKSIKEHTLSDEEDDHPTVAVKDKQKTPSRQGSVRSAKEHTLSDEDYDPPSLTVQDKKETTSPKRTGSVRTIKEHTLSDDEDDDQPVPRVENKKETLNQKRTGSVRSIKEHTLSDEDDDQPVPRVEDKRKTPNQKRTESMKSTKEHAMSDEEDDQSTPTNENKKETSLKGNTTKAEATTAKKRPLCKFGSECYRKNPWHLEEFYHPHLEDESASHSSAGDRDTKPTNSTGSGPPGKKLKDSHQSEDTHCQKHKLPFPARLAASEPFNFFVNKSFTVKETHTDPLSLVFPDLLNPQLGEIVESAQLSFMVDLEFLMTNYKAGRADTKPLLVMYGDIAGDPRDYPNVTCTKVNIPFQYGTHHTKMMLLQYKKGLRVVIHTANLVPDDWYEKTQGFWVSPVFPEFEDGKSSLLDGESPTRFKRDLVDYLQSYKAPDLTRWSHTVKKYDFSGCNAVFVGSTPGYHLGEHKDRWGHMKVRRSIRQHAASWKASVPVVAQCSSIGSLGKDAKSWLSSELGMSLTGATGICAGPPLVNVIYPSEEDIRNSSQGWMGGSCLPYNSATHAKQTWLTQHLHLWRSEKRKRSKVMPHIKTYTRLNKNNSSVQFFLLTSANISKAAWGTLQKQNTQLFIRSFEAGVLLIPKFVTASNEFELTSPGVGKGLSLPYDVPLTRYPDSASPWFMNTNKDRPDVFGLTYP